MFNKKIYSLIFLTLFIIFGLFLEVSADGLIPDASGSSQCTAAGRSATECGDYEVNDFMILALKISQWILGIVGTLTLVMFIYGGFMFLISAGSNEKVSQAKKIIVAAVVGLIIVFASWLIINFVFKTMGLNWQGKVEEPTKINSHIYLKLI